MRTTTWPASEALWLWRLDLNHEKLMTKTTVTAGVVVLLLVVMAAVVKLVFFPSVNDKYFQMNQARLRQAPPGLVIVRPTHFANSSKSSSPQGGFIMVSVKGAKWMAGRNFTFQKLVAVAYGFDVVRVALPKDAPKGNYDFLVTVADNPEGHLQSAIRKLGYTAQPERLDTPVLALKVEDPDLPGLKVSTATKENEEEKNGRLYFTHTKLDTVTSGLEQITKSPVVDKTGLTNFYDFSLVWNQQMEQQMSNGTLDQATGQKILADWGLALEPDTASLEMLVVKKTK
jgi:hypothetical protein